jgi:hypothetical protein
MVVASGSKSASASAHAAFVPASGQRRKAEELSHPLLGGEITCGRCRFRNPKIQLKRPKAPRAKLGGPFGNRIRARHKSTHRAHTTRVRDRNR